MSSFVVCYQAWNGMLGLSASSCFSSSFPGARVLGRSVSREGVWGRKLCFCGIYGVRNWMAAEPVEDRRMGRRAAVLASDTGEEAELTRSRSFLSVRAEEGRLCYSFGMEAEAGRLPSNIASGLEELYNNYRNAVLQSGDPKASEIILSNMSAAFDRILLDVEDPFVFSPYHKAIREPFDYYMFGQNYIRPLVDFSRSYVGNISIFYDMEEILRQGHNIVLMSNHQTEADPAIIALLLERNFPHLAEKMIFVAGDRVLIDPLCKPFSMGRNLLCVYSKKHMFDDPELAEMKRIANTKSLKELAMLLRTGSNIIWIAPSGGRDRPDPVTGEWYPASFDSSSVDNMRRLLEHSRVPGHIYSLALLCYEIMPPPRQVEKAIGERRTIAYGGVGLSVAPEMSFNEITAGCVNPEKAKDAFSQALYDSVLEQYDTLKSAIYGHKGLNASNLMIALSQPFQ
ncbi:glycerol-3-phosphate acyltransferase ATS12, chloroplastic isoform X3 [Dioscorea cayenensis subsp. rotundata]|uniref:Glycerol-3-phosphate acyltransferase, chloroplastic n=1 Tax=Dioscorea cayennensis subsp. rotundata TaxID=55577 RepID=A0AB40CPQ9_DIOCR|nr:glycerol-3-phosphate acyltransferase ATS12, chloroplastic isoform X3 [Dioscorea cayenensis subsp. rotundata]